MISARIPKNGKKQEYDFPRYFELIRKYQPNAVIFNDFGPDTKKRQKAGI